MRFKSRQLQTLILASLLFGLFACETGPGEGGTSSIRGKVFVDDYDNDGKLKGSYYGYDERVHLSFGDDDVIQQETRTGFDGTYEFEFLRKGDYKIYVMSKCDTCIANDVPIIVEASIQENRKTYLIDDIVIRK